MSSTTEQHQALILEQFSLQAAPFSAMAAHSEAESLDVMRHLLNLQSTDDALDVACGPGIVACAFAPYVQSMTGIDLTPAMIEQAELRQASHKLQNLSWLTGDVSRLPFGAASFDKVVTRYTFHHFLRAQDVFAEMIRVCRPGGRVMVVDVFTHEGQVYADLYNQMEILRDPSHTRALRRSELVSMFESFGLNDVEIKSYRLPVALEDILSVSFPNPGSADFLRELFVADINRNWSNFEPYRDEHGQVQFSFPVLILTGQKR
jgi:ubiquinone/menaquinone biosynthesis C-methylase UbiE